MTEFVRAELDAELSARVVARTPLFYAAGADAVEDRPAHVRAGSGISWFQGRLAVVQDDANFLALVSLRGLPGVVDPAARVVDSIALPRGRAGRRQFDDRIGNKNEKLDLEACVTVILDGSETLLAFGSGSSSARESIAVIQSHRGARVVAVPALYQVLRETEAFAGSELNVEGAIVDRDHLWLVQRGNGAPDGARSPKNAMGAVALADVVALLGGASVVPKLERITEYDLGSVDGVPLTFTDGAAAPNGARVYLAAAEASPDAVQDGPVAGCAVGVISGDSARYALIADAEGTPLAHKAEGIVLDPRDPRRAFVVIDVDDPAMPCELWDVELRGPWW